MRKTIPDQKIEITPAKAVGMSFADPEVVAAAINRLEHVKKASSKTLDDGWTALTVWIDSGNDARESIANLAAQHGWPLRSLSRQVATLPTGVSVPVAGSTLKPASVLDVRSDA